jgi:hypothetical protein
MRMRETSGIKWVVGVGKRARALQCNYMLFMLFRMYGCQTCQMMHRRDHYYGVLLSLSNAGTIITVPGRP